tara:strand:+ start:864 stop:1214 length:351 start_codon:yes stop_codon:yes gene_type:complete
MKNDILIKIEKLINQNKIEEAQTELSKLGPNFYKNIEYLFLRSKVFYLNKLYYLAIDTLLIALEFGENDQIYNLLAEIYKTLGNNELNKKFSSLDLRQEAANSLKDELSGIFRKNN